MKTIRTLSSFLLLFLVCTLARVDDLARREWKIDDVAREALVHVPATAKTKAAPVVTCINPGTHKFPDAAPEIIVKFFKEHQN